MFYVFSRSSQEFDVSFVKMDKPYLADKTACDQLKLQVRVIVCK